MLTQCGPCQLVSFCVQLEGTVQATTKQLEARMHELDALKVPRSLVSFTGHNLRTCHHAWPSGLQAGVATS